jgi:hypothetical protein
MDLVLLAAGKSLRYATNRPKYWLTMYDGRFMIEHVIDLYVAQIDYIHVVILREHDEKFNVSATLSNIYNNMSITVLDNPSNGPAHSAVAAIRNITDRAIFIKDCDSLFNTTLPCGNFICVKDNQTDPMSSYVHIKNDCVTNIAEKNRISDIACVGGYGFLSSKQFVDAVQLIPVDHEVYISHVINQMLSAENFMPVTVTNYVDLGNLTKFVKYNRNFKTIFCDIDGVIIKNQSEFFPPYYIDAPEILTETCNKLLELQGQGVELIFVTARPQKFYNAIDQMLKNIGFSNFRLLAGLHHSQRILINDYATTNPAPSAIAINLERNSNDLGDHI